PLAGGGTLHHGVAGGPRGPHPRSGRPHPGRQCDRRRRRTRRGRAPRREPLRRRRDPRRHHGVTPPPPRAERRSKHPPAARACRGGERGFTARESGWRWWPRWSPGCPPR
ncbi:MAG TPA: hypothetical protein ENK17_03115, partial [Anaerolineae bacterium]|nr:hypothetical protein [Anaerolineae bacterium]